MALFVLACVGLASAITHEELSTFADMPESQLMQELQSIFEQRGVSEVTAIGELLLTNTTSYDHAFRALNFSASQGDSRAYYPLGFIHMYNLSTFTSNRPLVPAALTYYYFAAIEGDSRALLAVAFRHLKGIDMPMNCKTSSAYYEEVAKVVIDEQISDQYVLLTEQKRLIHPWGGDYSNHDDENMVMEEFTIQHYADEVQGKLARAYRYYYGHRGYPQNLQLASELYQEAIDLGSDLAKAALGEMFLKGKGVELNYTRALELFEDAAEAGVSKAKMGLGYMYLYGLGVTRDVTKAIDLIKSAALAGEPSAVFNLGVLFLLGEVDGEIDRKQAFKYFNSAMHYGHTLSAYHLAMMHKHALDLYASCTSATNLFKMIAERGVHSTTLKEAYRLHVSGNTQSSSILYMQAADQGYQVAQVNAAYLLETFPLFPHRLELARRMLELASEQQDVSSIIRLGDYYYYGLGVPKSSDLALTYYTRAKELRNPQAMFNLGYMYHYGEGVEKDPHLAKRYYDLAIAESQTFNAPANIMLFLLVHELEWTELVMYTELLAVLIASLCCLKLI